MLREVLKFCSWIFHCVVVVLEEAERADTETPDEKDKKTREELKIKTEPVIEPKPSDNKLVNMSDLFLLVANRYVEWPTAKMKTQAQINNN